MAYICYKPKGSCEKCRHYRADENGRMICYAMTDALTANEIHEAIERYKAGETGYKPPINADIHYLTKDMEKKIVDGQEHYIYEQIMAVSNVKVNEAELKRALAYDRGQYDKGFHDGFQDGYAEREAALTRCRDCKYHHTGHCAMCDDGRDWADDDDYCSYAERKEAENG